MKINKIIKYFLFTVLLAVTCNSYSMRMVKDVAKDLFGPDRLAQLIVKASNGRVSIADLIKSVRISKIAEKTGLDEDFVQQFVQSVMYHHLTDKNWFMQKIEQLPTHILEQLKGAVVGAGTVTVAWLSGHALLHSVMEFFEPQQLLTAGPLAIVAAFGLYKALKYLKVPDSKNSFILHVAAPLAGAAIAGAAQVLTTDGCPDAEDCDDDEKEPEENKAAGQAFTEFRNSLTEEQVKKVGNDKLWLASIKARTLLTEAEFIQSLTDKQTELFSNLCKAQKAKKSNVKTVSKDGKFALTRGADSDDEKDDGGAALRRRSDRSKSQ